LHVEARTPPWRRVPAWLALAALLAWLALVALGNFPNQVGMDLYHPWGIQLARATTPGIGDPYVETSRYGRIAAAAAAASREADPKLYATAPEWAARSRAGFEPTATPFYYAAMSWLPRDYDRAQLFYGILQYAAFLGSIFALARMAGASRTWAAAIAAGVAATFSGFMRDIKFGNVNSLQIAFLTAMIAASRARLHERSRLFDRAYLPLLALFLVFKPSLPLPVLALALHYARVRGAAAFARGAALAAATALLAVGTGAAYFGTWHAWSDWLAYTRGANGGTLLYSVDRGNQSLPMLMAEKSSAYGAFGNSALLLACFALAVLVALSAGGKRGDLVRPAACRVLADPWLCVSVAVVLTCATAPLFWHHYYVALMVAIVHAFRRGGSWQGRALAAASYLALAVPALQLLGGLRLFGLAYSLTFFAWAPMVPAVLMELARERRTLEAGT
jgi:hypothetical protein